MSCKPSCQSGIHGSQSHQIMLLNKPRQCHHGKAPNLRCTSTYNTLACQMQHCVMHGLAPHAETQCICNALNIHFCIASSLILYLSCVTDLKNRCNAAGQCRRHITKSSVFICSLSNYVRNNLSFTSPVNCHVLWRAGVDKRDTLAHL